MATDAVEEGATFISQLRKHAFGNPQKPAFIFLDKNFKRTIFTRKDIWDMSGKFASVLRRQGIDKGDIVCNTLSNSPERLITVFGTILAGAVPMHGQIFLADGEDIMKNWTDSKCKAVLLDPTQKGGAMSILDRIKYKDEKSGESRFKGLDYLTLVIPINLGDFDKTGSLFQDLDAQTESYVDDSVTENDVAHIFATSGSTGFAKLVPHTHKSCLQMANNIVNISKLTQDSIYLNGRAFGWVGGFPLVYTYLGLTRILYEKSFVTPEEWGAFFVSMINQEGCDTGLLSNVETANAVRALEAGSKIIKPMRACIIGGSPVYSEQMKAVGTLIDSFCATYGSTEFGLVTAITVTDRASYEDTCVGYPCESVEIKVVDENMDEVPNGTKGEIILRAPTMAECYINNPDASKRTFLEDGWCRTSDLGYINNKGQLFVFCRMNNVINRYGLIHYPGWMELRINKHPDIEESLVMGIPDPVSNEEICLCLITTPGSNLTTEDVKQYCKSLFLTGEKEVITPIPTYYLFFDSFPKNNNGKVVRKALREEVYKRIGFNE